MAVPQASPPLQGVHALISAVMAVAAASPSGMAPPRMLENGAPFSFADLVERVSPAVVTVTVEEQLTQTSGRRPERSTARTVP